MCVFARTAEFESDHLATRGCVDLVGIVRIDGPLSNRILAEHITGFRGKFCCTVIGTAEPRLVGLVDGIEFAFAGGVGFAVIRMESHVRQPPGGKTQRTIKVRKDSRCVQIQKRTERGARRREGMNLPFIGAHKDPPRSVLGMRQVDSS